MDNFKISTGSEELDNWIQGYENDIITTIYGPAGSGKTNLCLIAATNKAKTSKVIFIDTEGGFSVERVKQLTGENYQDILKNIMLLKPTNFEEQKKDFEILLKEINNNIGLIIVDGMTMLYRLEITDTKDDQKRFMVNKELAKQLRILAEIARKKNIPILVTNQVYYDFVPTEEYYNGKEKIANMVGGDLLKYWSKCHIELQNTSGKRKALLRKHRSMPEKEFLFTITNSGLRRKRLF